MFQVGQQIIYGGNGVCTIEEITLRKNEMLGEEVQVYVIRLVSGLTSYVPVDSSVFMRALLTPEDAHAVIASFDSIPERSFPATNSKALSDLYRSILAKHDPRELLSLYKSLRSKIRRAYENGKRPGAMDERFASAALQEVVSEISTVLHLSTDEVTEELLSGAVA